MQNYYTKNKYTVVHETVCENNVILVANRLRKEKHANTIIKVRVEITVEYNAWV